MGKRKQITLTDYLILIYPNVNKNNIELYFNSWDQFYADITAFTITPEDLSAWLAPIFDIKVLPELIELYTAEYEENHQKQQKPKIASPSIHEISKLTLPKEAKLAFVALVELLYQLASYVFYNNKSLENFCKKIDPITIETADEYLRNLTNNLIDEQDCADYKNFISAMTNVRVTVENISSLYPKIPNESKLFITTFKNKFIVPTDTEILNHLKEYIISFIIKKTTKPMCAKRLFFDEPKGESDKPEETSQSEGTQKAVIVKESDDIDLDKLFDLLQGELVRILPTLFPKTKHIANFSKKAMGGSRDYHLSNLPLTASQRGLLHTYIDYCFNSLFDTTKDSTLENYPDLNNQTTSLLDLIRQNSNIHIIETFKKNIEAFFPAFNQNKIDFASFTDYLTTTKKENEIKSGLNPKQREELSLLLIDFFVAWFKCLLITTFQPPKTLEEPISVLTIAFAAAIPKDRKNIFNEFYNVVCCNLSKLSELNEIINKYFSYYLIPMKNESSDTKKQQLENSKILLKTIYDLFYYFNQYPQSKTYLQNITVEAKKKADAAITKDQFETTYRLILFILNIAAEKDEQLSKKLLECGEINEAEVDNFIKKNSNQLVEIVNDKQFADTKQIIESIVFKIKSNQYSFENIKQIFTTKKLATDGKMVFLAISATCKKIANFLSNDPAIENLFTTHLTKLQITPPESGIVTFSLSQMFLQHENTKAENDEQLDRYKMPPPW